MSRQTRDFFEQAGDTARRAGETVARAVGGAAETVGRQVKVLELKSKIRTRLCAVGSRVYDTHTGRETPEGGTDGILTELDGLYAELAALQEKEETGQESPVCPSCGQPVDAGDRFCRRCGAQM